MLSNRNQLQNFDRDINLFSFFSLFFLFIYIFIYFYYYIFVHSEEFYLGYKSFFFLFSLSFFFYSFIYLFLFIFFVDSEDHHRVIHTDGGQNISIGSKDRKIRFIDRDSGNDLSLVISGHAGSIRCVHICAERGIVLSGSYDTSIRWVVWQNTE